MMKKALALTGTMVLALILQAVPWNEAMGQTTRPGIDPAKCAELQSRLDEVVAISQSKSMSEQQKMSQLSSAISRSLESMIASTSDDPEAAKIAGEWRETLLKVMSSADVSGRAQDLDVSADAERGVDLIKKRIQPYIAVMKLLCPDLVVPQAVAR